MVNFEGLSVGSERAGHSGQIAFALAMTEYILGTLGATPEQIDRERQRIREEVFRISRANPQR